MFYETFEALCKQNGISPFACCKEIGLSGGSAAYWKKSGRTPKRETLEKLAERFGVTVDCLIGREKATEKDSIALKMIVVKDKSVDYCSYNEAGRRSYVSNSNSDYKIKRSFIPVFNRRITSEYYRIKS